MGVKRGLSFLREEHIWWVFENGAEENIWAQEVGSDTWMEKIQNVEPHNF
jgi:hypothetical protein